MGACLMPKLLGWWQNLNSDTSGLLYDDTLHRSHRPMRVGWTCANTYVSTADITVRRLGFHYRRTSERDR